MAEIKRLANVSRGKAEVFELGKTHENRTIYALKVSLTAIHQSCDNQSVTTPRKYALPPCSHLDFKSAITAQNDELNEVFTSR